MLPPVVLTRVGGGAGLDVVERDEVHEDLAVELGGRQVLGGSREVVELLLTVGEEGGGSLLGGRRGPGDLVPHEDLARARVLPAPGGLQDVLLGARVGTCGDEATAAAHRPAPEELVQAPELHDLVAPFQEHVAVVVDLLRLIVRGDYSAPS